VYVFIYAKAFSKLLAWQDKPKYCGKHQLVAFQATIRTNGARNDAASLPDRRSQPAGLSAVSEGVVELGGKYVEYIQLSDI